MRFNEVDYEEIRHKLIDEFGFVFVDVRTSPEELVEIMVGQMHNKGIFETQDLSSLLQSPAYIINRHNKQDLFLVFNDLNLLNFGDFKQETQDVQNLMTARAYYEQEDDMYECTFCHNNFSTMKEERAKCPHCSTELKLG